MIVRLLFPRLDCSFKEGPVPVVPGPPNNPVRYFYLDFKKMLEQTLLEADIEYQCIEKPLWQFTQEDCKNCDYVFIPHRHQYEFPCDNGLYYMQMGLPFLFSVDHEGWCADSSFWPLMPACDQSLIHSKDILNEERGTFDDLKHKLVTTNTSKFGQPNVSHALPEDFLFFACQLPHDSTIMNHSVVSVAEALKETLDFGKKIDRPVVVKGHPVNLGSMAPLRQLFNEHSKPIDYWIDNISIHECLEKCDSLFTVNSGGVGLEAILHEKPVFAFGRADYSSVVCNVNTRIDDMSIESLWVDRYKTTCRYRQFMKTYFDKHYDVHCKSSFTKIVEHFIQ